MTFCVTQSVLFLLYFLGQIFFCIIMYVRICNNSKLCVVLYLKGSFLFLYLVEEGGLSHVSGGLAWSVWQ
jgi:hypothetical protein